MSRTVTTSIWMAIREQRADLRTSLCHVLAFASVLAPLLILLGLKNGLIDTMTERLLANPSTLEILPVGAGRYDAEFFEFVSGQPETAFVAPRTRTISSRLVGVRNRETRTTLRGPALLPTGRGDPVTGAPPPDFSRGEVVLSAEAARRLQAAPGAVLEGWTFRAGDGGDETVRVELTVTAIAPAENYGREAIFAPPELLVAVENFLDGEGEAGPDWMKSALQADRRSYASFRLYAVGVHEVSSLRDKLEAHGARVRTRSDEIALVTGLDHALNWLYAVLAVVAGGGFWLSLAANLRANVERLRDTLSMFRLLGAAPLGQFVFPMAQALTIVWVGAAAAALVYFPLSLAINSFADSLAGAEKLMRLGLVPALGLMAVLTVGAMFAALWAGREAMRIEPSDVIRRV